MSRAGDTRASAPAAYPATEAVPTDEPAPMEVVGLQEWGVAPAERTD